MDLALQLTQSATRPGQRTTFRQWARPDYTRKYGLDTSKVQKNIDCSRSSREMVVVLDYAARTDIFINR
jgi:hypothetical protein